jgi:hypothetical protein
MKLWTLPFRFLGILALAVLVSGAWLFRHEILRAVRPPQPVAEQPGSDGGPGVASPAALDRARDKVDSLHGWQADSIVLSAAEMASIIVDGLPDEARRHLDSVTVVLGEDRVTVSAKLETSAIPHDQLGPLAGALEPWERVVAGGRVVVIKPGSAEWRVDSLALRGFTLPEQASRRLIGRALDGAKDGAIPLSLPRGISGIRVRTGGVALFRGEGSR